MTGLKLNTEAEQFFSAIAPTSGGKSEVTFNYLALLHQGQYVLICSRLYYIHKTRVPFSHIATERIRAGQYRLSDLKSTPRELVQQILSGTVKTPNGDLHFPIDGFGNTHTTFQPFHAAGLASQSRMNVLRIDSGGPSVDTVPLDWELKATPTPFDGLHELLSYYSIGEIAGNQCVFEAVAHNVAVVDSESAVTGTTANMKIRVVDGLPVEKASIGYRVLLNREVIVRDTVAGNAMKWEVIDDLQVGSVSIEVPRAAVVQCIACYNGVAQSSYWIADNANFQNPRRAAYEAFDPGLSILNGFLQFAEGSAKGKPQHDLETGVSWLLWMLGFSAAHLGATAKTSDAADLIVATPNGSIAVVECTLGLLKAENKLANIVKRTEEVKERLQRSNNGHLQVIPAIVSSLAREKLAADLEQAEKLGVLVLTKENLQEGVNRTMLIPDADQYYREAIEVVRAGVEKHRAKAEEKNGR
ncbi:hypothetical protein [Aestuariivirga sp.]|uniref:hypothetical protein n=1 Tax=Aestuariivirga sp. TaxID=2650926 RepID=UPI0035932CC6